MIEAISPTPSGHLPVGEKHEVTLSDASQLEWIHEKQKILFSWENILCDIQQKENNFETMWLGVLSCSSCTDKTLIDSINRTFAA